MKLPLRVCGSIQRFVPEALFRYGSLGSLDVVDVPGHSSKQASTFSVDVYAAFAWTAGNDDAIEIFGIIMQEKAL
jgi:hypothetical protein